MSQRLLETIEEVEVICNKMEENKKNEKVIEVPKTSQVQVIKPEEELVSFEHNRINTLSTEDDGDVRISRLIVIVGGCR
jgi:hypothetical protein